MLASHEEQIILKELQPLNHDYHRRLCKRLRDNLDAIQCLRKRGLSAETVAHFGLGLSLPYTRRKIQCVQADALVYPVIGIDGAFYSKYGYYNLRNLSQNPEHEIAWAHGEPRATYAEARTTHTQLFICSRADELWLLWQSMQGSELSGKLLLATTTHGAAFPVEWTDKEFWKSWERIYCSYPGDEIGRIKLTKLAHDTGRFISCVQTPDDKGADQTAFAGLLTEAQVISPDGEEALSEFSAGRHTYDPVNINGAYHDGHLYYSARALRRQTEINRSRSGSETARFVERIETVVVRSDRTAHTAQHSPAPRGTIEDERVLRLTDGTLIDRAPRPNRFGTWSWTSIKDYLDGVSTTRPLGHILKDITLHLKSSVFLPRAQDYTILTLLVPVVYAQAIFECVPLLFINGPADSGKSTLGRTLADVCANAHHCTRIPLKTALEVVDEARGLTVIDDIEKIDQRNSANNEIIQVLLRGFDKAASLRAGVRLKSLRIPPLNIYGVKAIISRQSFAGIPDAATLRIRTQKWTIKQAADVTSDQLSSGGGAELEKLRDEIHTWTFTHVETITSLYQSMYREDADLTERVTAPLRVMAAISADEELQSDLEIALGNHDRRSFAHQDPQVVIGHALRNLIEEGYDKISILHLTLEIRRLLAGASGAAHLSEFPAWSTPGWVARMALRLRLIHPDQSYRLRFRGMHLRFYLIDASRAEELMGGDMPSIDERPVIKSPTDFCGECSECVYNSVGCSISLHRK